MARNTITNKPKRFVYQCLMLAMDALFRPISMPFRNVFVSGEADMFTSVDINTIKTTGENERDTLLPVLDYQREDDSTLDEPRKKHKLRMVKKN